MNTEVWLPLPSSHLAFSDQCSSAKHRVESLGFKFSSSQPFTQGDGNCMLHALMDQLKKCNHPILRKLTSSHDLRLYICSKLMEQIEGNHIFWVQTFSPESWLEKMRCNSYWCDDVFIQIAANILISISSWSHLNKIISLWLWVVVHICLVLWSNFSWYFGSLQSIIYLSQKRAQTIYNEWGIV